MSEFDEYIVHGEPGQKEKADVWQTAIGLQDVDGLKVSSYLLDTARQHIKGDISIDEARDRIKAYYETKSEHDAVDEEGDKASVNIAKILSEPSFAFSLVGLTSIHRRIFEGVFKFAGQLRKVELSKKEWVLGRNASVSYQPAVDLREAIEYDLSREKEFDYSNRPMAEIIKHLSHFIADLWQIHPFREGNTRTTAVFLIKYLRSMGIPATNDMFKHHSWYFRNALVRASYKGLNIAPTTEFVERFLRNVILDEKNELRNRDMLVGVSLPATSVQSITMPNPKSQFDTLNCTLEELAVLKIIEDNPKITQTEIAKSIQKSASTVKRITSDLVKKGIISRRNGRRNGWWEILSKE
ncbi:Fic family protein [uncultured Duncaniella sp.]|uniref:Fic family protein n=1 Tax=uncultured Duncaniella sp. TaxID=2768039 RepID=UPI0025A96214|nr:Fic family protein [uncultured Duncaniella sp.]